MESPALSSTLASIEGLREAERGIRRAGDFQQAQPEQPSPSTERRWSLETLGGRLCELTSTGRTPLLTLSASLLLQAQQQGQPVAWIAVEKSTFYPPDLAAWGIDLAALPLIRLSDSRAAARAADHLLRSGSFGLVILDLGAPADLPVASQTRLVGLLRKHHAVLLCLSRKSSRAPSLGSLVSLRGEGHVRRAAFGRFLCELHIVKDKRNGPNWCHMEEFRGPDGLC